MSNKDNSVYTKECPFCHKNKTKFEYKRSNVVHYNANGRFMKITGSIRCNCCFARGPAVSLNYEPGTIPDTNGLEEAVTALWNGANR